jgi:hypothetical protein
VLEQDGIGKWREVADDLEADERSELELRAEVHVIASGGLLGPPISP